MENKETFWQVFLRKDNIAVLIVAVVFIVIGIAIGNDDGGWVAFSIGLFAIAVDALLIYLGLNKNR